MLWSEIATMRPIDPVTYAEAAHILGVTSSTVRRHVLAGRLVRAAPAKERMISRTDVEALALQTYRHHRHKGNQDSYWVTGQRAADILGVNVSRLNQLVARGFLPYKTHIDGTRMYRREQLMTVSNAREARWR